MGCRGSRGSGRGAGEGIEHADAVAGGGGEVGGGQGVPLALERRAFPPPVLVPAFTMRDRLDQLMADQHPVNRGPGRARVSAPARTPDGVVPTGGAPGAARRSPPPPAPVSATDAVSGYASHQLAQRSRQPDAGQPTGAPSGAPPHTVRRPRSPRCYPGRPARPGISARPHLAPEA